MSDMWSIASVDVETEQRERLIATARIACAEHFAFASEAASKAEFVDRLSLVADKVESVIGRITTADSTQFPIVHAAVLGSWEDDFASLTEARLTAAREKASRQAAKTSAVQWRSDGRMPDWGIFSVPSGFAPNYWAKIAPKNDGFVLTVYRADGGESKTDTVIRTAWFDTQEKARASAELDAIALTSTGTKRGKTKTASQEKITPLEEGEYAFLSRVESEDGTFWLVEAFANSDYDDYLDKNVATEFMFTSEEAARKAFNKFEGRRTANYLTDAYAEGKAAGRAAYLSGQKRLLIDRPESVGDGGTYVEYGRGWYAGWDAANVADLSNEAIGLPTARTVTSGVLRGHFNDMTAGEWYGFLSHLDKTGIHWGKTLLDLWEEYLEGLPTDENHWPILPESGRNFTGPDKDLLFWVSKMMPYDHSMYRTFGDLGPDWIPYCDECGDEGCEACSYGTVPNHKSATNRRERRQASLTKQAWNPTIPQIKNSQAPVPSTVGHRECDTTELKRQIGNMNILAISGGRILPVFAGSTKVGVSMPVSGGYSVNVVLDGDDTYIVQRVLNGRVIGQQDNVYFDEVGEAAYQASSYKSNDFGGHVVRGSIDGNGPTQFGPDVQSQSGFAESELPQEVGVDDAPENSNVGWVNTARRMPQNSRTALAPSHLWCSNCDEYTPVAPKSWGGVRCLRCGDDYSCGECGGDVDRNGVCEECSHRTAGRMPKQAASNWVIFPAPGNASTMSLRVVEPYRASSVGDLNALIPSPGCFIVLSERTQEAFYASLTSRTTKKYGMDCPTIELYRVDTVVRDGAIWGERGSRVPGVWAIRPEALQDGTLSAVTASRRTAADKYPEYPEIDEALSFPMPRGRMKYARDAGRWVVIDPSTDWATVYESYDMNGIGTEVNWIMHNHSPASVRDAVLTGLKIRRSASLRTAALVWGPGDDEEGWSEQSEVAYVDNEWGDNLSVYFYPPEQTWEWSFTQGGPGSQVSRSGSASSKEEAKAKAESAYRAAGGSLDLDGSVWSSGTRTASLNVRVNPAVHLMNRTAADDPCWDDYEMVGMKEKDGEMVPNCVPSKKSSSRRLAGILALTSDGEYSVEVASEGDVDSDLGFWEVNAVDEKTGEEVYRSARFETYEDAVANANMWAEEPLFSSRHTAGENPFAKKNEKDADTDPKPKKPKAGAEDGEGEEEEDESAETEQAPANPPAQQPAPQAPAQPDPASDPTAMTVGQKSSMTYTMADGTSGSLEVVFVREENGVYFFNGPTGEFGVANTTGAWNDADGNTFTFAMAGNGGAAQQAQPASAAPAATAEQPKADGGEKKDGPPWDKKAAKKKEASGPLSSLAIRSLLREELAGTSASQSGGASNVRGANFAPSDGISVRMPYPKNSPGLVFIEAAGVRPQEQLARERKSIVAKMASVGYEVGEIEYGWDMKNNKPIKTRIARIEMEHQDDLLVFSRRTAAGQVVRTSDDGKYRLTGPSDGYYWLEAPDGEGGWYQVGAVASPDNFEVAIDNAEEEMRGMMADAREDFGFTSSRRTAAVDPDLAARARQTWGGRGSEGNPMRGANSFVSIDGLAYRWVDDTTLLSEMDGAEIKFREGGPTGWEYEGWDGWVPLERAKTEAELEAERQADYVRRQEQGRRIWERKEKEREDAKARLSPQDFQRWEMARRYAED